MSVSEDLRTFCLLDATVTALISDRMEQNKIDQELTLEYPRVWYQRRGRVGTDCLDGSGGPTKHSYDVEAIAESPDDCEALADAVTNRLDGYSGTFGGSYAQGVFVEDQDDDYVPKNTGADNGLHLASLSVVIWTRD